jgi:FMN hydrolase / 5-amino-6-(5-phospho-D-ribitylamino)uracil phosphatase
MGTSMLAVTLDLDDTLWPVDPAIEAAERALMAWFSDHAPKVLDHIDLGGLRRLRADQELLTPALSHDLSELRLRSIRAALALAGYPLGEAEAAFRAFMSARNTVTLYPEVLPALTLLSQRYQVGVISNGNADIEVIGLSHLFGFHVTARAAGACKPDHRIFSLAIQRADVPPERMVHVGDDPVRDVLGAKAAGMRAVWLDRNGSGARPPEADAVIADLSELVRLLMGPGWA